MNARTAMLLKIIALGILFLLLLSVFPRLAHTLAVVQHFRF
jgi:hypothetical protein